jgi:hypothetical protein
MSDKQISERNELFDSTLREQLTGYEPQVPHALWNRISAELDKGEAPAQVPDIPSYHGSKSTGKWKIAIAAAVLLTLTVGTLLYTLNPQHVGNTTSAPIANKANINTVPTPAAKPAVHVSEAKLVAQQAPITKKKVSPVPAPKAEVQEVAVANPIEPSAPATTSPAKQDETAEDMQLEFAPVTSENKPIEVGNIPMASLNILSTPSSLNDEITVIKSPEKKKRHGRKEESTKVIVIGKKFDNRPDIQYQVPVRF